VVVENRAGANGQIGCEMAARLPPDGHGLVTATADTHCINPQLYASLPYDAAKDFTPVAPIAAGPLVLLVRQGLAANSLAEFITLAKAGPALRYGSWGEGSTSHLAMEWLKSEIGAELLHAPYRGVAPMVNDLLAGHIDCALVGLIQALNSGREGRARPLAVTSAARDARMPDVPAVAETMPGYVAQLWWGIMAPAATPAPIVARLNAAIAEGMAQPETRERIAAGGTTPLVMSPAEFAAFVQAETATWARVNGIAKVRLG
jgi:tripartite-type tricarboxylate transporter receptor subunit TctC